MDTVESVQGPARWTAPGTPVRVLLAAPEARVRRLLTRVLRAEGYAVAVVEGHEALEAVLASRAPEALPDVVLSCLPAPVGGTGLEALAALRARGLRTTAFVLVTPEPEALRAEAERLEAVLVRAPLEVEGLLFALLMASEVW